MIKTAPVLPARSMDFNTLNDALTNGESDEDAIAKACGDEVKDPPEATEKTKTTSSTKAAKKG